MANELVKAIVKIAVGVATAVAGGTLVKKGNDNYQQHKIESGKTKK